MGIKIFLIQPKARAAFKSPPLGLQIIAAVLKQHGYKDIYDIDRNKGDDPYTQDYSGQGILVGMTVTFMTISEAFRLAKFIKSQNPKAKVVFGGPQPTLMPEESINNENVDAVVIGEGEYTMLEIADRTVLGRTFEGIEGLWYKDAVGKMIKNSLRHKAYIRLLNKTYRQIEAAIEIR